MGFINKICDNIFAKISPKNEETKKKYISVGLVRIESHNYEDALRAFDGAIEIDPSDATAWLGKGVALQNLGKYEEAVWTYNKAIEIFPESLSETNANAWLGKGFSLQNLGMYGEAIWAYDKGIEIFPDFLSLPEEKVAIESFTKNLIVCMNKLTYSDKSIKILEKILSSTYLRMVDEIQGAALNKINAFK